MPVTIDSSVQQDLSARYERDGYVLIKNAVPPEQVREIRRKLLERMQDPTHRGLKKDIEKTFIYEIIELPPPKAILMDCFLNAPETLDLICNEKTVSALKTLLGENFVLLPDATAHWEYFNVLHTDTTTPEQRGRMFHLDKDYRILIVAVYLQDNTPEHGGGMYVVPGSNKKRDPYIGFRKRISKIKKSKLRQWIRTFTFRRFYNYERDMLYHPGGLDVPHQAGDVLITDMRIIHRSSLPQLKGAAPDGGKVAIYAHISANNHHVENYLNYTMSKGGAYQDLLDADRGSQALKDRCREWGFTAL